MDGFSELCESAAPAVAALTRAGWRVAVAESCTGGLIMAALTAPPGASAAVERGVVCYSNEAKTDLLGVPQPLMIAHGAVSEPVAGAMAAGLLARSPADVALAVTGVAGPGGGTAAKPVGLVCLALAQGANVWTETRRVAPRGEGAQMRAGLRAAFAAAALEALRAHVARGL